MTAHFLFTGNELLRLTLYTPAEHSLTVAPGWETSRPGSRHACLREAGDLANRPAPNTAPAAVATAPFPGHLDPVPGQLDPPGTLRAVACRRIQVGALLQRQLAHPTVGGHFFFGDSGAEKDAPEGSYELPSATTHRRGTSKALRRLTRRVGHPQVTQIKSRGALFDGLFFISAEAQPCRHVYFIDSRSK